MTLEEAFFNIAARYPWTATWLRLKHIIVAVPELSWEAKSSDEPCPFNATALGCRGITIRGMLSWVGWDFDVGHGKKQYPTTAAAIADAQRLRRRLDGRAEIRLSKSGVGVHVYHLRMRDERPAEDGPLIAKAAAKELGLRCDPTPLGRQAFWLWCRNRKPDSFRLIEAHRGI